MLWATAYSAFGEVAGTEGPLFKLWFLEVTAYLAGYLVCLAKLPALLGMMLMGLLLRSVKFVEFSGSFARLTSGIR